MGTVFGQFIEATGAVVWGPPMLLAFLGVGLLFTLRTKFFQITHAKLWVNSTVVAAFRDRGVRKTADGKSISQLQALAAALAACIGTGNIVGVATAIYAGGPGAVFWMWVSAVLGMMTCCAENILGILYRYKNERGDWIGGAMVYIEKGLGWKKTASLFSLFLVFASFGIGNMTQANSIAGALKSSAGMAPAAAGIMTALLAGLVIIGGIKRIAAVAEKIVPFMSVVFIGASLAVIAVNAHVLPAVFKSILSEAFNMNAAAGGAAGFGIAKAARYGIARGVFSNEAGLGSSAIIHAAADVKEPATQGMWGILEVFLDTVVMCTITALAILTSGVWKPAGNINGVELCSAAFSSVFGNAGGLFLSVSIVLFAFATLIGWSYYGERGAEYLFGLRAVPVYKAAFIAAVFIGCTTRLEAVWNLSDIFNGMMAVPNLLAVTLLSGQAVRQIKDFELYSRKLRRRVLKDGGQNHKQQVNQNHGNNFP